MAKQPGAMQVVQAVFPGAQLKVFGSFSTGLHLPTSDVDCVILDAQVASVPMALTGLGKALQRMEWSSELEVRKSPDHVHAGHMGTVHARCMRAALCSRQALRPTMQQHTRGCLTLARSQSTVRSIVGLGWRSTELSIVRSV